MRTLLNVGAGPATLIPEDYADWHLTTVDIDPTCNPDILADMRELPASHYDAIYASHCLEHIFQHEVVPTLTHWATRADLIHVRVPNVVMTFLTAIANDRLLTDPIYDTPGGLISANDVMHGWSKALSTDRPYYAHKTSFGPRELADAFTRAGLQDVVVVSDSFDLVGLGRAPVLHA